jgi:hypothetical protein
MTTEFQVEKARVAAEVAGFEEKDRLRNQSYAFFLKKIADIAGSMNFEASVDEDNAVLSIDGVNVMEYMQFMEKPGDVLRIVIGDPGSRKVYPPKRNNEYSYDEMAMALIKLAVKKIRSRANDEATAKFCERFMVSDKVAVASSDLEKPITIDLTKVESHTMNLTPDDAEVVVVTLRKYGFLR